MPSISPAEAINRPHEPVVVEMLVKRAKSCTGSLQFFLDSEANHRDPNNLGVVVTTSGAAWFKEARIDNPAAHFEDKSIPVRGMVIRKEDRPCIEVDDPVQTEVVT